MDRMIKNGGKGPTAGVRAVPLPSQAGRPGNRRGLERIVVTHISEASRRYAMHLAKLDRRTERWHAARERSEGGNDQG